MNFKKSSFQFTVLVLGLTCWTLGCGEANKSNQSVPKSDFDASGYLAKAAIPDAKQVIAARKDSKNEQEITIVGRIGGSIDPWVKGRAAFSLVDSSIKACSDETPDGEACSCETPWDYCCETDKLKDATVLVKFVDEEGKVLKHDARAIFELTELQTVSIQGKAERDDSGNLTILAKKMFIH